MKKVITVLTLVTIATPTLAFDRGTPEYEYLVQTVRREMLQEVTTKDFTEKELQCFADCVASKATMDNIDNEQAADQMGYECGLTCLVK